MEIMLFVLGTAFGSIIMWFVKKPQKPMGTLRIDNSDPFDGPHMFLEVHTTLDRFVHRRFVTFEVNQENFNSQD